MPYWYLTLPVAGTNAHSNPSAEYNATGWAGTAGGTATRQAGTAAFGAWAVAGTVGAAQGTGVTYGTIAQAAGSYTVSAYVYGGSGSVYSIGIKGTGAGAAFVGSTIGTTGGTWHRYSFSYGESGAANRLFAVVKRSAGADSFLVDGVQVEGGTFLTTYIDGDQEGCLWLGAPQASASQRSGTSRQGGTVVALADLGLTVLEQGGAGMPPVANIMQEYAVADGALWQRQRATSRVLTLTGLMSGTTWPGLHAIRQGVIDAVKINRTPNPQPVRFLYTGAGGTTTIDGYYDGGLAFESRNGFSETTALRFLAPDPYWYAATDEGTALAAQVSLGSVNFVARRSPTGQWGTMGPSGSTLQRSGATLPGVNDLLYANGTLFMAGFMGTIAGTAAQSIAMWFDTESRWGTFTGGTIGGNGTNVTSLARNAGGTVFLGGQFLTAGGTASPYVAQWTSAGFGSMVGGTVNNTVDAMSLSPAGTLVVGGPFTSIAGTAQRFLAQWAGAWGTLTGGTSNTSVAALAHTQDGTLFAAGALTEAGGTTCRLLAYWSGAWGTTGQQVGESLGGASLSRVGVGLDGLVYVGGYFSTAGPYSSDVGMNVASYNRAQFAALANGLGSKADNFTFIYDIQPYGNTMLFSGTFRNNVNGQTLPDSIVQWNGYAFLPLDINFSGSTIIRAVASAPDNTLFVGGDFYGPGTAAAVTTIINGGAANAYPTLVVRNPTAVRSRLFQLVNYSTGDGVWFNMEVLPGETLTLDLRNNAKTFTSDARGNVLGNILPGSNLSTWKLSPGTNYVSFYAGTSGVEASLSWRPRAWSQDDRL